MSERLSITIVWAVSIWTPTALLYEVWALVTEQITISRFSRTLAEAYHPVYVFAGVLLAFLFLIALIATHLPVFVRVAVLAWLIVFGHVFWGFC